MRLLEVCVDSYESAVAAINGGANRLELCCCLDVGGLTPTVGLLKQIQTINTSKIPIFCILRCRASNFIYTPEELNIMITDAQQLRQHGADGFVFGALQTNGDINMKQCREIIKICYPSPVTFHRAFDLAINPLIQLECVIDLGFTRLLTSGQKPNAEEGLTLIKQLIKRAKNRIVIIPASGLNKNNIKLIMDETEAKEFHGSFREAGAGTGTEDDQFGFGSVRITDTKLVSEMIQILKYEV